jgi:hypothetical protein
MKVLKIEKSYCKRTKDVETIHGSTINNQHSEEKQIKTSEIIPFNL